MSKRINSIDALRIIAAFFIICIHASYFGKEFREAMGCTAQEYRKKI